MPTQDSPAALRNREPIATELTPWLSKTRRVLEIASGRGTHVDYLSQRFSNITWQPSEYDQAAASQLALRVAQLARPNVLTPLIIDVSGENWSNKVSVWQPDAVLAINMVHISPFAATRGLLQGAAALLNPSNRLLLYGPYKINNEHTSPGNAAFDVDLQQRNPAWGIRDIGDVTEAATRLGFELTQQTAMPSNNQLLVYTRAR